MSDNVEVAEVTLLSSFREIWEERQRQETLVKAGKFLWTCASANISLDRKMSVLSEEVGETANEIVEYGITSDKYEKEQLPFPAHRRRYYLERIRTELIQVAAVCVAWIEALDKQIQEYSEH